MLNKIAEKKRKIVIVDDDDDDLYLMRKIVCGLQRQNIVQADVTYLNNGDQAIQLLQEGQRAGQLPDMLCLDLHMPDMSGFDLLRHCRAAQLEKALRIVVMTASTDDSSHQTARAQGAHAVHVKPSQMGALTNLLKCLLTRH